MSETKFEILPFCESFYMESMLFITESALRSVKSANEALKKMADRSDDFNQRQTLNYLQNIVVQGAALSRYFWPARKEHEKRGEILRKAFNVTDTSPLKSRDLRNEIEHFDEKLDVYLAGGIFGVILPHYIGSLPDASATPSYLFRAYYTDKAIFEILGKRYEINPITKEIGRIHKLLDKALNSDGGRLLT
jgi:hypothetical protein